MMRSDNAGDDRQAQPTARSTACRVPPPEALEGTRSVVRLHAWPVVFHLDHALLTVACHTKPDTSAGRRVDVRIGERLARTWRSWLPSPVVVTPSSISSTVGWEGYIADSSREHVARELREIDWLVAERPALVEASEEKQILDERRHARALLTDTTERVVDRSLLGERSLSPKLGDALDDRHRCPKLMGSVGDESAKVILGGLLFVEHDVESASEMAGLTSRSASRTRRDRSPPVIASATEVTSAIGLSPRRMSHHHSAARMITSAAPPTSRARRNWASVASTDASEAAIKNLLTVRVPHEEGTPRNGSFHRSDRLDLRL